MGIESGAASSLGILNFTKYGHHASRHQFYEISTRGSTDPRIRIIEKYRESCPANTDAIQGVRDFIHELDDLGLPIRIQQFIMNRVRQFGRKFEAANKGLGIFRWRAHMRGIKQ